MNRLQHDWLTEGLIDFEYKKYVLLAYLKDIKSKFDNSELFPFLSDLVFHLRNLEKIRQSKQLIYDHFPKSISKADFEKLKFSYQLLMDDDEVMKELEEIIAFALPKLEVAIEQGKDLFDFVEDNVELSPVGLSSIYEKEGYLFISSQTSRKVSIYRYQVSVFMGADDQYRGISTTYLCQELKDYSKTYEKIRLGLTKSFKDLPNPATYLLNAKLRFPEESTLLPIAKRLLIRNISVS